MITPIATPDSIEVALIRREGAREAQRVATAALVIAHAEVERAEIDLAQIDAADGAATSSLIASIRSAAAGGALAARPACSAGAHARTEAEARARAAQEALDVLARDAAQADADLAAAEFDLRLATLGACRAEAAEIVRSAQGAIDALMRAHAALVALERVAFTPTPSGLARLGLDEKGRQLLAFEIKPPFTPPALRAAQVESWLAWRESLISDPAAPSPWRGI